MKIFKELKKLGYKHYTEHTIEELDNLPLNSEERIMEQALVLRWFREKYGLDVNYSACIPTSYIPKINFTKEIGLEYRCHEMLKFFDRRIFDTKEEAELASLKKLIEICRELK